MKTALFLLIFLGLKLPSKSRVIWDTVQDAFDSGKYYARACGLGNGDSCVDELKLKLKRGKIKEALKGLQTFCKKGEANACYQLGLVYEKGTKVKKNKKKSDDNYRKACRAGKKRACKKPSKK